jgi:DNA-binding transcriptional MocR family regulator
MKIWGDPEGGLFLWAEASEDCDSSKIAQKALQNNILLAPGNVFSVTKAANRFIRFNTANSQDSRIFEFLKSELSVR